jgi:hypothetical protein
MESSVLSLPLSERERTVERAQSLAMPWQLAAVVFASTSIMLGLIWDISWHMTIGRDTFWTPAHLAIYIGGAVAGIACGFEVLRRSFFPGARPEARDRIRGDGVTIWRVFTGPLGGWICIWGAVAMLTSAPFDDWWHNAYGLDVKIISPPHTVLALGFWGILIGALVMSLARQSREESSGTTGGNAPLVVAYMSGVVLTLVAIFTYEYQDRTLMHNSIMYRVMAIAMPFALVSAAVSTRLRYPATAAAGVYTAIMCLQLWILPLFPASPKLGPIRMPVDSMVPLDFPLLLIVPALVIDVLLRRTLHENAWLRAVKVGVAFVVIFTTVQWAFGEFLMHGPSQNAFFRTDNFPYLISPEWPGPQRRFTLDASGSPMRGLVFALLFAILSARAGLAWGGWLRAVRR